MAGYDSQYYANRIQTPTPGHQPIYGQVPFNWITTLVTEVAPRNLSDPGVATPILIGVASKSGAIIESHWVASMAGSTTTGGGGYNSGGTTTTDYGYGTAADPTFIHVYTRREPDDKIFYLFSINLFTGSGQGQSRYSAGKMGFQILPDPQVAWRLEPGQEVYVALSRPVAAPGMNILIHGMHYS
jgi:hypothetical protein